MVKISNWMSELNRTSMASNKFLTLCAYLFNMTQSSVGPCYAIAFWKCLFTIR